MAQEGRKKVMKQWYSIECPREIAREFVAFAKDNGAQVYTSAIEGGFTHVSVYCDADTAALFNMTLDSYNW